MKTAHELLIAGNFPGCSQYVSVQCFSLFLKDIINRPNISADERKHYQDILKESANEGYKIVEKYQREIFEFQCD